MNCSLINNYASMIVSYRLVSSGINRNQNINLCVFKTVTETKSIIMFILKTERNLKKTSRFQTPT